MNGIDVGQWDPETSRHLPARARYTAATVSSGKAAAKALFQQRYGLQANPSVPLVGVVGRLAPQKGVDVVLAALPHLLGCPTLGRSEPEGASNTMSTSCSALRPCSISVYGPYTQRGFTCNCQIDGGAPCTVSKLHRVLENPPAFADQWSAGVLPQVIAGWRVCWVA